MNCLRLDWLRSNDQQYIFGFILNNATQGRKIYKAISMQNRTAVWPFSICNLFFVATFGNTFSTLLLLLNVKYYTWKRQ